MVKRLRHRPFTAVTRVRFPLGSPLSADIFLWPDGQAAKTPPFHGGNAGSIPARVSPIPRLRYAVFFLFSPELSSRSSVFRRGEHNAKGSAVGSVSGTRPLGTSASALPRYGRGKNTEHDPDDKCCKPADEDGREQNVKCL